MQSTSPVDSSHCKSRSSYTPAILCSNSSTHLPTLDPMVESIPSSRYRRSSPTTLGSRRAIHKLLA